MALGPGGTVAPGPQVNRSLTLICALMTLGACERSKTRAVESEKRSPSVPAQDDSHNLAKWDDAMGTVIATPSVEDGAPLLVSSDTTNSNAGVEVDLFSHDAQTVRARLHSGARTKLCMWQRSATLSVPGSQVVAPVWTLALARNIATPIALDGVSELSPRDSADLVARVSAFVSALPDDSASLSFHGLPIVVRDAWRFRATNDSTLVVVAIAARTLNIESNPRSEVVTIIVESDASTSATGWRAGFAVRDAGSEDRIEGSDLLAALRLGNGHSAVALLREDGSGSHIEIVERTAPASWRLRWSSKPFSCTH